MWQGFQADFRAAFIPYSIKTIGEANRGRQKQAFLSVKTSIFALQHAVKILCVKLVCQGANVYR